MTPHGDSLASHLETITSSGEPLQVARAAMAIAASEDRQATIALAWQMGSTEFLERLDTVSEPQRRVTNLRAVFEVLEKHPSESTRLLCETVAQEQEFLALPVRMNYLLPTLLAVRPLTEAGAAIVRDANSKGFFGLNGPLLLRNGSPLAHQIFERMVLEPPVSTESLVDMIHHAVLPMRGDRGALQVCFGLIQRRLPQVVEDAIVETLYDHLEREWFGVVRFAPQPPAWNSVPRETRWILMEAGKTLLAARRQPENTLNSIERTLLELDVVEPR